MIWGAYHGLLLVAYKAFARKWDLLPHVVRRGAMFVLTLVGWVFFRSTSFAMAGTLLTKMFAWQAKGAPFHGAPTLIAILTIATVVVQSAPNTFELSHQWTRLQTFGLATCFAASLAMTYALPMSPFLYFQF